jgi:hypothetical protein
MFVNLKIYATLKVDKGFYKCYYPVASNLYGYHVFGITFLLWSIPVRAIIVRSPKYGRNKKYGKKEYRAESRHYLHG